MEMRKLGGSALEVSGIGLGLMSMSGIYGNASDEESVRVIHHALDQGINFLDSADMYGWGHNETLLGKALRGRRDGVIVATKFGQTRDAAGKQGVDGRPPYVMQACEASLKRLGIEVIDLYYQHRVDPDTPIEDTVGAMKRLGAGQGARHRPFGSASRDHSPRAQGASARRGAERIFPALQKGWRRDAERDPRARHLARRLRAARPQHADRLGARQKRPAGRRSQAAVPALPGRQLRQERDAR